MPLGGTLFLGCTFGAVYVPCFTCVPGGVSVGDSVLFCCVPCLFAAINSLRCFYTGAVDLILFQITCEMLHNLPDVLVLKPFFVLKSRSDLMYKTTTTTTK